MYKDVIKAQVLVIGGGPAGLAAGVEVARQGLDVLVLDDKKVLGGQLVKQTHMFFGSKHEGAGKRGTTIADELVNELTSAGGRVMTETMVLGMFDDGIISALHQENNIVKIMAEKTIIATGAYENMLTFPGCDLPGVYGAGGFQTLMNVDGVLPGKKILMVGAGNIGLIVSYQLMQAGGQVVALAEGMSRIGGYKVHADKIRRMGVPIHLSHSIKAVHGTDRVEAATLVKVDEKFQPIAGTEFTVEVDAVCLSVGLSPLAEIFHGAGCRMEYVPALGGNVPYHDENMRTSNPDVFVAGDSSGIEEASVAMIEGKIAGVAVAEDLLGKGLDDLMTEHKQQLNILRGGPCGKKARHGKALLWGIPTPVEEEHHNEIKPLNVEFDSGKRLVIECRESIPCNPCESHCPKGAIIVGDDISSIPQLDRDKCNTCGLCMMRCPGLAIFMVDMDYSGDKAEVTIPYEVYPIPAEGDVWKAIDRDGNAVCEATVTKVRTAKSFDRKYMISFAVDKKFAHQARHLVAEVPQITYTDVKDIESTDPLICRCEDVRQSEIESLIDQGYTSFDEIKRITRVGMGPCQGKTCQRLILQILARKLGLPVSELVPMTVRAPLKPVTFETLANVNLEDEDGDEA